MRVEVLEPHGFCMGVRAAIDKALHALAVSGPLFCLHQLVHNESVVADLRAKGMRVVEALAEVPEGGTVLFSAHGVGPEARHEAARRGLRVIDATCPFVARVHRQVRTYAARGLAVVVVGHADHVEVRGVVDEAREAGARVAVVATPEDVAACPLPPDAHIGVVSQTTLSDNVLKDVRTALRARCRHVETTPASEACTATRDRQEAVRRFVARGGDGVLVLGSATSSNTRRLAEIAEMGGARVWRVATDAELSGCDFTGIGTLGVTSGASTPEAFLERIRGELSRRFAALSG